jgi:cytochrome c oxidase cbb3-type subunit 2
MKRTVVVGLAIVVLIFAYGYSSGMMGRSKMDRGMMGRGMMNKELMQWFNGKEVDVTLNQYRPHENEKTVAIGKKIYQQRCTACHGENGDGNGPNSEHLITKPTDFTAGLYKFRSTPSGSLPTDEDIYTTVSKGIRGTAMLPWFDLSDNEKWYVSYYIKSLSERFEEEDPDFPVTAPETGTNWNQLVNKGRYVYDKAKCWECHGEKGRGDGEKAGELKDDWGRSVKVNDFTREPLKRGGTTEDIYLTISTGLDGTPMASYSSSINPEDMLALSSYIKSLTDSQKSRFMGRMDISQDERIGMMAYHHGGMGGMMHGRMMGD